MRESHKGQKGRNYSLGSSGKVLIGLLKRDSGENVYHGTGEAREYVERAMRGQMAIDKLLDEMERIADFMVGLTKREYKTMRIQKKKAA